MNIAAILAALIQIGVCAPTEFHGSDGSRLTVLVCPMTHGADASKAPEAPADDAPKTEL